MKAGRRAGLFLGSPALIPFRGNSPLLLSL